MVAKKTKKSPVVKPVKTPRMNIWSAYVAFWRRGFTQWNGTSSRSEYWGAWFVNALIVVGLTIAFFLAIWILGAAGVFATPEQAIPLGVGYALIIQLYALATFIPWLSMDVRRLHDIGLVAGWWIILRLGVFLADKFMIFVSPNFAYSTYISYVSVMLSVVIMALALLPTKTKNNPYLKKNK